MTTRLRRLPARLTDERRRLADARRDAVAEVPAPPDAEQRRRDRARLERILCENVVPFWWPAAVDDAGGYRLDADLAGTWSAAGPKRLVGHARTLWFFSRLAGSPYGTDGHLDAARHGFAFLRDRLWDDELGGFHWEVDRDGRPTAPDKSLYGQTSALYALTEYGRVSGDGSASELCRALVGLLEEHALDAERGGYREFFRRDWTRPPDGTKAYSGGVRADAKTLVVHIHLLESLTSHYEATGDPTTRERLVTLLTITGNTAVRKDGGACTNRYSADWTPARGDDLVDYGDNLKNIWLVLRACRAAGLPERPLVGTCRAVFANALRYGYDRRDGGFYALGRVGRPAHGRDKVWWVQAEALLAALHLHRLTGEAAYYACFSHTLDWIVDRQVDWAAGEWFDRVPERGAPTGVKAGPWKDPYHGGRALLDGIDLLDT